MKLDASQLNAIASAVETSISIITGGAGTGKTTIIKQITETLESRGDTVSLCAFAGKAAARIREACNHPASTIHRLLGFNGKQFMTGDLSNQTIIIDEASMIDSFLLAEITRRHPARLVLVGDPAQLPPVGRAQPFHDLINLRPDIVSALTTCYRATEAVFQAATQIRNGGRPALDATSDLERWTMRNTGDPTRTQATILSWIDKGIIDFDQDVILCARNGDDESDPCTIKGLNAAIVDLISPRRKNQKFNVGDRVINGKNLPDLDVWNGTTGRVHAIDDDGGVYVKTDVPVIDWSRSKDDSDPVYTSHVLFGKDIRSNLSLAYAMTVHKSQGSQYRNVLITCFCGDGWGLLDRSLLYTAVTRTKSACCVIGELSAVWAAIDKQNHKNTVMQECEGIEGRSRRYD